MYDLARILVNLLMDQIGLALGLFGYFFFSSKQVKCTVEAFADPKSFGNMGLLFLL